MARTDANPITFQIVFEAQATDTPLDVHEEVRVLWRDMELMNDDCYYSWNSEEDGEIFPVIDAFLKSRGVTECLIHWWW